MLLSGLPEHIADDESVARFLTSDGQFNRAMAKPSAYMPGPVDDKTSVFRQNADVPALWATADQYLAVPRRAKAAAMLTAGQVKRATLDVEASEPPARHANIMGWPSTNDADVTRAQRRELALLLIQSAVLIRR